MKPIITKEEAKKYMASEGEARGLTFKSEGSFILKKEGEEGLRKLEEALAKAGQPIDYRNTRSMSFYPRGMEILTLVGIKRIFNYDDDDFRKIGAFSVKVPLVIRGVAGIRGIMSRVLSFKRLLGMASDIWDKYYSFGDLKITSYDENSYIILRISNFNHHPLNCLVIEGALAALFKMIVGRETTCEEVKCTHKGDKYDELVIKWN